MRFAHTLGRFIVRATVVVLLVAVIVSIVAIASLFGPPLLSGGLFLTRPAPSPRPAAHGLPATYEPLHQGHVDVATGLYIREDEDLSLSDAPAFVWRRAYLSGDHQSRQFGVGATDNADWYLIGDADRFAWLELVREDGSRIHFDRLTPGSSYANSVFGHTSTVTSFYGAMVGWTGFGWALRARDGTVFRFQACGPRAGSVCSLLEIRDPSGQRIELHRNRRGLLHAITNGRQEISLEYDPQDRIAKASDSAGHVVNYSYDARGRLIRAASGGIVRSYAYDAEDHLVSIRDPNRVIENAYDKANRLVGQTVREPGAPDYRQSFAYRLDGDSVIETDVTENDGSHTRYRFDRRHQVTLQLDETPDGRTAMISFEKDGAGFVRALTVRCTKNGRRVTTSRDVTPGDESRVEAELLETACDLQ